MLRNVGLYIVLVFVCSVALWLVGAFQRRQVLPDLPMSARRQFTRRVAWRMLVCNRLSDVSQIERAYLV